MSKETPSEYFEAQEKKDQHEKGRQEAIFYRHFLDEFHKKVYKQLEQVNGLNEKDESRRLGDLQGINRNSLERFLNESLLEANKFVKEEEKVKVVTVVPDNLLDMTVGEFFAYIKNLESSLIK